MDPSNGERIVMTPKKKTATSTTLKMERKLIQIENTPATTSNGNTNSNGATMTPGRKESLHIAGGKNAGIVVNKEIEKDDDQSPAHLSLQFRVFLRNATTKRYTQEKRVISYWFKVAFSPMQQASSAQDFFKQLVSPADFPRDYVGFIKKIMKLMQHEYPMIAKIEIEMTQEMEMDCLPIRPTTSGTQLYCVGRPSLSIISGSKPALPVKPAELLKRNMMSCQMPSTNFPKNGDLRRESKMGPKSDGTDSGESSRAESAEPPLSTEDILGAVEEAYPNSLTIDDMSRRFKYDKELIRTMVLELVSRNLVKPVGGAGMPAGMPGTVDTATGAFRRVHHQTEDGGENVTVVKGPMRNFGSQGDMLQPTIAIITVHYFEKMAVDAMMTNKQTFVRYATVGEANVYTLGDIGKHRVVSTKLPMAGGQSRDALIATGGTTTRLLGTFQGVEKVFLVGVGGAVPHYTDFNRHVRLGDVVMSAPPLDGPRFIYQYCENVSERPVANKPNASEIQFETKSWCPVDLNLQEIAHALIEKQTKRNHDASLINDGKANLKENAPWLFHYSQAVESLENRSNADNAKLDPCINEDLEKTDATHINGGGSATWRRPSGDLDRLYMSVGNADVIEVGHPEPKSIEKDPRQRGEPVLHVGPIGAGRRVAFNERLRHDFSSRFHGILAFDCELDSVIESIYGNRKDSYMLIRGISDYKDGTTGLTTRGGRGGASGGKEWQQYAALMAASVLKSVVCEMD